MALLPPFTASCRASFSRSTAATPCPPRYSTATPRYGAAIRFAYERATFRVTRKRRERITANTSFYSMIIDFDADIFSISLAPFLAASTDAAAIRPSTITMIDAMLIGLLGTRYFVSFLLPPSACDGADCCQRGRLRPFGDGR